jgi:hypothetical protein
MKKVFLYLFSIAVAITISSSSHAGWSEGLLTVEPVEVTLPVASSNTTGTATFSVDATGIRPHGKVHTSVSKKTSGLQSNGFTFVHARVKRTFKWNNGSGVPTQGFQLAESRTWQLYVQADGINIDFASCDASSTSDDGYFANSLTTSFGVDSQSGLHGDVMNYSPSTNTVILLGNIDCGATITCNTAYGASAEATVKRCFFIPPVL